MEPSYPVHPVDDPYFRPDPEVPVDSNRNKRAGQNETERGSERHREVQRDTERCRDRETQREVQRQEDAERGTERGTERCRDRSEETESCGPCVPVVNVL